MSAALYDVAALAQREPATERQAQAWERKNYFIGHVAELEAKRSNGAGTDSITAQRRKRGAGYLHVRDCSELDGYAFRSPSTRHIACVLLSLLAYKKMHAIQGSYEGLAEMMGVFGRLCSKWTIRNALAELVPLGLKVEPYFECHPEGFHCRPDRKEDDETKRRMLEWAEAAPLYSVTGQLARLVDAMRAKKAAKKTRRRSNNRIRIGSVPILSGSGLPLGDQQRSGAHVPCGKVAIPPSARRRTAKERPAAAKRSTARPAAAPEETAMKGEGSRRAPTPAHSHARPSAVAPVPRSETPASRRTPAPIEAPQAAPVRRPPAPPPPELVRELVALALSDASPADRAARLAELEAMADQAGIAASTAVLAQLPVRPAERLTPLQERKRNAVVLPFIRAQHDAGRVALAPTPSPAELRALDAAEGKTDAEKRSRGRVERPSGASTAIGGALGAVMAGLEVRRDGGSASDQERAVAEAKRTRRREGLDAIGAAVEDLQEAIARARLPLSRIELIDRAIGNIVALHKRGEIDMDTVLRQLDAQRRIVADRQNVGPPPAPTPPAGSPPSEDAPLSVDDLFDDSDEPDDDEPHDNEGDDEC